MWHSFKISHVLVRIFLAVLFFWCGADKFFHPDYWLNNWIPGPVSTDAAAYLIGAVEILIGVSLATNMFIGFFSVIGTAVVAALFLTHGLNQIFAQGLGLIGPLLALSFWPAHNSRRF
ncbi:MAG: hypothetical protein UX77_C0010G0045 [Parcubacteria group bacterium GW2011_GWA1_47_11]|nr:MAG: hypothetical protein UX77_C0010G0045 [Parcubacteria group bacterium GW2011_GWA1_47_11]